MNTHAEYRRYLEPTPPTRSVPKPAADQITHLAIHGDPSLGAPPPGPTTATGKQIAWVRPTELHAYADHLIGRGIDLQAELTRRARQVPRVTTRAAAQSVGRTAPAHTGRDLSRWAVTHEGIEL